ncbi:EamA family transporter [Psychroserpens burtonensis]|uniref:EamA family transporter n=1 Tax=Psychroserpens burtonensis TaxID=49278 RepID=A0A5C7B8N9_9FLAO|nr:EamA family transporter [Psychroserpens burtonensis]TXE17431.1 EamA family transporter [Psychroserpens burtonensis]
MIYLLLSIVASTCIFIIFKLFDKYKINTLQAIVVNYFIACLFGLWMYDKPIAIGDIIGSKWIYGAIGLGFLFIAIFNVMALTAQRKGLSVASVASKMSVIIPVIFGIYIYNEGVGVQKVIGILLALVSVYLSSVKSKTINNPTKGLWLPILLFFGSGIIDTSIKYIETTYLPENSIPIFSASIFAFAFIIGASILIVKAIRQPYKFPAKSVIGGIILGMVNYFSIYYLLKALNHESLESSTLFTVNNVAIVMVSTLLGLLFFKEKISKINWMGIILAIISIVIVTLA